MRKPIKKFPGQNFQDPMAPWRLQGHLENGLFLWWRFIFVYQAPESVASRDTGWISLRIEFWNEIRNESKCIRPCSSLGFLLGVPEVILDVPDEDQKLQINFNTQIIHRESIPRFTFTDLVSSIGGYLGIFIGISIMDSFRAFKVRAKVVPPKLKKLAKRRENGNKIRKGLVCRKRTKAEICKTHKNRHNVLGTRMARQLRIDWLELLSYKCMKYRDYGYASRNFFPYQNLLTILPDKINT